MRITKLAHSCVRLSATGGTVVLDPGGWTEPGAAEGADAVLVTHEHPDHWTPDQLRACDAPIVTIEAVRRAIAEADPALAERVTVVSPGQSLDVAGFAVQVVGERHAVIHPELPRFDNSGFVLEADGVSAYHPGDSFERPGRPVDVFLGPACAPWARMSELIDLARDVAAPRTVAIHDAVYSAEGLGIVDRMMTTFLEQQGGTWQRLRPGADLG